MNVLLSGYDCLRLKEKSFLTSFNYNAPTNSGLWADVDMPKSWRAKFNKLKISIINRKIVEDRICVYALNIVYIP